MKRSQPRTMNWKAPVEKTGRPSSSREATARRLKAAVVVVACVLGVGLGIGSAMMGQLLFASAPPSGPGRSISLGELQRMLGNQAEGAVTSSPLR